MEGKSSEIPPMVAVKEPRKLTRRNFLRISLAAGAAAPLVAVGVEKAILKGFSTGLSLPGATDHLVTVANKAAEISKASENQEFKPIYEIIKEGVNNFEASTGKKVFYRRSKDYKDLTYYRKTLDEISALTVIPRSPTDILEKFKDYLPYEAQQAYFSSNLRIMSYPEIFAEGSGLYKRFKDRHPTLFGERGQIVNYDKFFEAMEVEGPMEMKGTKDFVEQKKVESGGPVSTSVLLQHYLEKNEGDLARSIYDTALFLKFMARSDLQTAYYHADETTVRWFQENIKDEYRGSSYVGSGDTEALINLLGKPYHSWNLVALTAFFPVEFIHTAGVYRQLVTMHEQGIDKTKADLQTLQDLRQTEQVLISYSQGSIK